MKEKLLLLLLIILGFIFRWRLISSNHFEFYYYQARDAVTSRSILENYDFKIQGPATSGTDDKIYNGVLYYYVIGPLYTLSKGNPLIPTLFLSLLSSLAIIPIYLIGKEILKSKNVGVISALFYAFSTDSAQLGSWLSNPSLATWIIPWFYYFLWRSLFQKEKKFLPLTALMLGLANQATLYTAYLIGIVLIVYTFQAFKEKIFWFMPKKTLLKSIGIYLISISSMVLTQALLLINNIFKLSDISLNSGGKPSLNQTITDVFNLYINKVKLVFLPSVTSLSIIIVLSIIAWFFIYQKSKKIKAFLALWIFSPAILFLFISRGSYYSITGLEPAIYLIIACFFYQLFKKLQPKLVNTIFSIILIIFLASNLSLAKTIRQTQSNILTVQNGAFLNKLLELVDYTYEEANGDNFSISTLTSPYKYNTTWAYLYSWYGMDKYGYLPKWIGSDQAGITGDNLLEKANQPNLIHFSIYESDPGGLAMFIPEYQQWQEDIAGPVTTQLNFGSLSLERRDKIGLNVVH